MSSASSRDDLFYYYVSIIEPILREIIQQLLSIVCIECKKKKSSVINKDIQYLPNSCREEISFIMYLV